MKKTINPINIIKEDCDMFVILSYDINQKRVGKVLKICRKYLVHIHKSVFEGSITEKKLRALKGELKKIIKTSEDSVCIYSTPFAQTICKEEIGISDDNDNII